MLLACCTASSATRKLLALQPVFNLFLCYMDRSGQLQALATLTPYENACSTKRQGDMCSKNILNSVFKKKVPSLCTVMTFIKSDLKAHKAVSMMLNIFSLSYST